MRLNCQLAIAAQFVRYWIAGAAALVTHIATLYLLVEFHDVFKPLASSIGFCAAVPVNYILQYKFVFDSERPHLDAFARYLMVTLTAFGLNLLIFWTLIAVFDRHYLLMQGMTTMIVVITNFMVNRGYTFANARRAGGKGSRRLEQYVAR